MGRHSELVDELRRRHAGHQSAAAISSNRIREFKAEQNDKGTAAISDVLYDGTMRRVQSDSRQCHRPFGFATECDALEGLPYARTTGNASCLARGLPGKAGDKLQDQASSVVGWCEFPSKCHLHFFKELLPLRLRKTNHEPGETRR